MLFPDLIPGRFVCRDNRFRATVQVDAREVKAHVPNSGRLADLFVADRPIWLARASNPGRKTPYDLKLVELAGTLVSVDARLPNHLFAEALHDGRLTDFSYPTVQPEVVHGDSRLDFRLSGPDGVCWVETKSVTLVEDGLALFPDVPTERGRRHLAELQEIRQAGQRAAVVFVIQRPDADALRPHQTADPRFADALRRSVRAGVEAFAYTCSVSLTASTLAEPVAVLTDP
jgi:sugar fermentation stimulation protein A